MFELSCIQCEASFKSKEANRSYCSEKCRRRSAADRQYAKKYNIPVDLRKTPPVTCQQCSVEFTPIGYKKGRYPKFCSRKCMQSSHYQRTKEHQREQKLVKYYGIDADEYNQMAEEQGKRCALCHKEQSGHSRQDTLSVDHCHDTDKVRGLLCHKCNTALGLFDDDPDLMLRAAQYIRNGGVQYGFKAEARRKTKRRTTRAGSGNNGRRNSTKR